MINCAVLSTNADIAETYVSDAEYEPGTVLIFGGSKEVTIGQTPGDSKIAGIVTTDPAYVMNAAVDAEYLAVVALLGRVPAKVTGKVSKGDLMVSAGCGYACACATPVLGSVIGKSLEDFDGDAGVIEIVVGRI